MTRDMPLREVKGQSVSQSLLHVGSSKTAKQKPHITPLGPQPWPLWAAMAESMISGIFGSLWYPALAHPNFPNDAERRDSSE